MRIWLAACGGWDLAMGFNAAFQGRAGFAFFDALAGAFCIFSAVALAAVSARKSA